MPDNMTFPQMYTTAEDADVLKVHPQTQHRHLCELGHYYRIRLVMMPSARRMWPAREVHALVCGEADRQ